MKIPFLVGSFFICIAPLAPYIITYILHWKETLYKTSVSSCFCISLWNDKSSSVVTVEQNSYALKKQLPGCNIWVSIVKHCRRFPTKTKKATRTVKYSAMADINCQSSWLLSHLHIITVITLPPSKFGGMIYFCLMVNWLSTCVEQIFLQHTCCTDSNNRWRVRVDPPPYTHTDTHTDTHTHTNIRSIG